MSAVMLVFRTKEFEAALGLTATSAVLHWTLVLDRTYAGTRASSDEEVNSTRDARGVR